MLDQIHLENIINERIFICKLSSARMQIMERRHLLIWLHNSNRTIWQNVGTFLISFKSSFRDANGWFHFPHVICRVSISRAVLDKMTYHKT